MKKKFHMSEESMKSFQKWKDDNAKTDFGEEDWIEYKVLPKAWGLLKTVVYVLLGLITVVFVIGLYIWITSTSN
jgi:hypothetical protein